MTKREIKNRINNLEQRLFLTQEYTDYFITLLGKKGTEKFVNATLDELSFRMKQLEKLKDKNHE